MSAGKPSSVLPWREALLLAAWLLATIAVRPLLLPDEGRYASVAWEMLRTPGVLGTWVPTLNGLPFFHKPPLLYALDQAAMALFGLNEFAARCGPALLAWLLGMAMFLHARRWHGEYLARIALLVLATSPFFFIGGQYVNHDIGVAGCITAAVLCIVRAVDNGPRNDLRWLLAGWAFCGLGVLAKGLIGLVLPALVIGPWLLAQGRWRQMLALLHPLGLLAFAAVVLPWMALMQSRFPGFFDYFIVEQHFRRYTGTTFNNRMPVWFYFVVLPLLMLPWPLWLYRLRLRNLRADVPVQTASRLGLYVWWLLVIVGFFSLPASKLVGYVLPALAPAALLLALVLQRERIGRVAGLGVIATAACIASVVVLAHKSAGSNRELAQSLAAQMAPGDRVVFVEAYYYDVPYYARLPSPVVVLADWKSPEIGTRDNWQKELYDATRFAADGGASVLWTWDRLPQARCGTGRVWVLADVMHTERLGAAMPELEQVGLQGSTMLLRAPGTRCAGPAG